MHYKSSVKQTRKLKTKVLMFGRKMKSAPNQKPLGHLLASIDNFIYMKSVIWAIKIRTNVLSNNFQSTAKVKLINSRWMTYGCSLWNFQDINVHELDCCRRLLRLQPTTKVVLTADILDTFLVIDTIEERMINFIMTVLKHSSCEVAIFLETASSHALHI